MVMLKQNNTFTEVALQNSPAPIWRNYPTPSSSIYFFIVACCFIADSRGIVKLVYSTVIEMCFVIWVGENECPDWRMLGLSLFSYFLSGPRC